MINLEKDFSYIEKNLEEINVKIKFAAEKSGRKFEDITLVGVTKTIDLTRIQKLISLGVTNLGENKVQELMEKQDVLGKEDTWHMIGHLQTNKVKYIMDTVSLIHSVDSLKLAKEIDNRASKKNIVKDILIEVNIAKEESKSGVDFEDAFSLILDISKLSNVRICGLMTIAPFVEIPENNRNYFKNMHNLFVDINDKLDNNRCMKFLSMGMTNDYEVAIEEGANIVRIGTGIFGKREYV